MLVRTGAGNETRLGLRVFTGPSTLMVLKPSVDSSSNAGEKVFRARILIYTSFVGFAYLESGATAVLCSADMYTL